MDSNCRIISTNLLLLLLLNLEIRVVY